jgi:ribosomal protein L11 methyltransferase
MTQPTLELAIHLPAELADLVSAWLFEAGATGVEERETDDDGVVALVVYSTDAAELTAIEEYVATAGAELRARGEVAATWRFLRRTVTTDWETEWLRHVRAVPLGDAFVAQPVGDESPLPRARRALRFRPAWAFGDGTHPTTQLAAAAVEAAVRARPGVSVLDVGTGSGILALLSRAAGAGEVVGIDVDAKAIEAARENLALNPELEPLALATTPLAEVDGPFSVVVANITESTLCELAPELTRVAAPDGQLLLTGLITGDTERLESLLANRGWERAGVTELREWTLLELRRRSPRPARRGAR